MLFNNPISYANIVAGSAAIIVSVLILIKDFKSVLNVNFFLTFLFWGASWVLQGLIFLYEHPTKGAQIIRDFIVGFGTISSFIFFVTAFIMFKGEHYLKKWYFILPIIIAIVINTVILVQFDHIVYDSPDGITDIGEGIKSTQDSWVLIFLFVVPGLMVILSLAYLIKTRIEVADLLIKKRILFFILGFSFVIIGMLIIGLAGVLDEFFTLVETWEFAILIAGNIFWFAAPILCFVGFNIGRIRLKSNIKSET
ncbi:MAG: hypothetical protein FK730_13455 [Asgard group archaeon]|nr:hypothetical protein [Asgard group archaeon]